MRLIPLSADGHLVPGLPADTHYLLLGTAVDLLCQRCGRSPESGVRRRVALLLAGLSAAFLSSVWATGGEPGSAMAVALTAAAVAGGPAWALAFLAVPAAWMAGRRRAARAP